MRKTKLIEAGDKLDIELTDEELTALSAQYCAAAQCWKEGDEFEWIKTEDGEYKLMKINTQEEDIKVNAELDDRAFAVGDFIHQLSEIQDQKFEALWQECKEKEWIKGMDEENAKDWLFDYLFNGWGKDSLGFHKTFSEYIGAEWE